MSPADGWELYSRGSYIALPGADAELETAYSVQDYLDVDIDDGTRVSVEAEDVAEYVIHQFKDYVGAQTGCYLSCNCQSALAPSASIVKLQIYNYDTTTWDDLGAGSTNNTADADTDFDLVGTVSDLADYKSPQLYITCRVYQRDA